MCRADTGSYPTGIYNDITCGGQTYLSNTPKDPVTSNNYAYTPLPSDCSPSGLTKCSSYILCAALEIGGGTVSGCGSCGTGVTCNYKVTNP